MLFVNTTKNTVKLSDIGLVIPYLGEQPQEIATDDIKRSKVFQMLVIGKKFAIVSATEDRIEQNLLRFQKGNLPANEPKIEVMVRGHFFSNTGYGKANRNLVYALSRAGCRVGIETGPTTSAQLNKMELERIAKYRRTLPNSIRIDSMIPTFSEPTADKPYSILNTTVEAASVPAQFVDACEQYDEVWVASDFCKTVLTEHGVEKPIYVIPNAVEASLYNDKALPHVFDPPLKKFVFVSVMSWSHRKGYDVLINAYLREFSADDDVSLLIVTPYDNGTDDAAAKYIKRACEQAGPQHAHIARVGREVPEFEMPRLYKACNCFVLPSRGEGFGLPYVEAGMCGLPIIATNHSGHTMFLNKGNAYLLDIDRLSELPDGTTGIHYWDGQLFPELTDDNVVVRLGCLMADAYTGRHNNSEKLKEALSSYTLEAVGKVAAERLKQIWKTQS